MASYVTVFYKRRDADNLCVARCLPFASQSTNDADMGWREFAVPSGLQDPADLLQLAGHSVDACMSLSFAAIQFKFRQEELYAKLRYEKLTQTLQAKEAHYRKKIGMMNQGFEDMKRQVDVLRREKQDMEGDIRELRDKYSQKTREARSLRAQASGGHGGERPGEAAAGYRGGNTRQPLGRLLPANVQVGGTGVIGGTVAPVNGGCGNHGHLNQRVPGINGLPVQQPAEYAYGRMRTEIRTTSHDSPGNLMPRSRSPHAVRTLAYGSSSRYASPHATPVRSSPSMLIPSGPMGAHRTPPSSRRMTAVSGGLQGLGGSPMMAVPLGRSAQSG